MERIAAGAGGLRPERAHLGADLAAGLSFAVVNVPQAMGHALLATVNPVLGIFTLIVAMPVGALFTGSVFMNVSTSSALAVATASGLAEVSPAQRGEALAALVMMVGIIQVLAGLFRLGSLTRFVSNAVMTGFLNGVAVLIILGQLGGLTGFRSSYEGPVSRALDFLLHLGALDRQVALVGGLTLVLIVLALRSPWRKFAFIIAIGLSTAVLAALARWAPEAQGWDAVPTVASIANIPSALPELALPAPGLVLTMLLPAISLAIIGMIQGAGISQAYPNPDGKFPDVSRDFLGQGAANVAAALAGGIPAGGSVSGTVLMTSAGARSRWANILAGLGVALIVLVAAPLVELVPMPALSALLIVAGIQGLRVDAALVTWHTGKVSRAVMVLTFVATLFVPLQYAVLLGVALNIVLYMARQSNQVVITEWVLVPGGLPLEQAAPRELPSHRFTMLQVYGSLSFAAAGNLEALLPDVEGTTRAAVALGLRGKIELGSTFIGVLRRYALALQARDSRLMLVGVDEGVRTQLARTGLLDVIGPENVFLAQPQLGLAMNQAAAAAYAWLGETPGGPMTNGPLPAPPADGGAPPE